VWGKGLSVAAETQPVTSRLLLLTMKQRVAELEDVGVATRRHVFGRNDRTMTSFGRCPTAWSTIFCWWFALSPLGVRTMSPPVEHNALESNPGTIQTTSASVGSSFISVVFICYIIILNTEVDPLCVTFLFIRVTHTYISRFLMLF